MQDTVFTQFLQICPLILPFSHTCYFPKQPKALPFLAFLSNCFAPNSTFSKGDSNAVEFCMTVSLKKLIQTSVFCLCPILKKKVSVLASTILLEYY